MGKIQRGGISHVAHPKRVNNVFIYHWCTPGVYGPHVYQIEYQIEFSDVLQGYMVHVLHCLYHMTSYVYKQ